MRTYLGTRVVYVVGVCVFLFGSVGQVKADTITMISSITGPGGMGSGSVATINPDNDNVTTNNPNIINITKTFLVFAPIDIVFDVANSAGTTEYFITETIVNQTDVEWRDFHFELGFRGFGTSNLNFVSSDLVSSGFSGLDFDTPNRDPAITSSVFTQISHGTTVISLRGGSLPPGSSMIVTFSLDIPPMVAELHLDGLNQFTIRQTPSADPPMGEPAEPTTITLLTLGLAGVAVKMRKRLKSRKSGQGSQ